MSNLYSSSILGMGAISSCGDQVSDLADSIANKAPAVLTPNTTSYRGKNIDTESYQVPKFDLLFPLSRAMERRLGRLARLSFQAILRSMKEAEFEITNPSRVGIVIGTAHGSSSLVERYSQRITLDGIKAASPILFSNSVHNSVSSFVALSLGINGPSTTIVSKELSTAAAIERANVWLNEDLVDHVLLAVGDEYYNKIHVYNNYVLEPIDPNKFNPLVKGKPVIGEGALGMVLSKSHTGDNHQRIQARTYCSAKDFVTPEPVIVDYKGSFESFDQAHKLFNKCEVASYAKNYGSFTTGGALDVAIAAHGLKESKIYSSTAQHPEINTLDTTLTQVNSAHLMQVSDHGELGYVQIKN